MLYPENPIPWNGKQPPRQFPEELDGLTGDQKMKTIIDVEENRTLLRHDMDEFANNTAYLFNKFKDLGFNDVISKDLTICFYDDPVTQDKRGRIELISETIVRNKYFQGDK